MSPQPMPYQSTLCYHAYTLWLFIASDVKSIVLPSTIFAFAQASVEEGISMREFAIGLPRTVAWILINLLAFSVNN